MGVVYRIKNWGTWESGISELWIAQFGDAVLPELKGQIYDCPKGSILSC